MFLHRQLAAAALLAMAIVVSPQMTTSSRAQQQKQVLSRSNDSLSTSGTLNKDVPVIAADQRMRRMVTIQKSVQMMRLPTELSVGDIFDSRLLVSAPTESFNTWYPVPAWLAGNWRRGGPCDYFSNFAKSASGTNTRKADRLDLTFGDQTDQSGAIWNFDKSPYLVRFEGNGSYVLFLVDTDTLFPERDKSISRELRYWALEVDRESNRIKRVYWAEEEITYEPQTATSIACMCHQKQFSRPGERWSTSTKYSGYYRASRERNEPYRLRDSYEGNDLKRLFQDFLAEREKTSY